MGDTVLQNQSRLKLKGSSTKDTCEFKITTINQSLLSKHCDSFSSELDLYSILLELKVHFNNSILSYPQFENCEEDKAKYNKIIS